jgi:hypothetical protein
MQGSYKRFIIIRLICVTAIIALILYDPFAFQHNLNIDDMSSIQEYAIGNSSFIIPAVNIRGSIKGEINGQALIIISENRIPLKYLVIHKNRLIDTMGGICLFKGKVDEKIWRDYYKDYYHSGPGYIYFVPISSSQGTININWDI